MNSPKETLKHICAIWSLVWSIGKGQDYVRDQCR